MPKEKSTKKKVNKKKSFIIFLVSPILSYPRGLAKTTAGTFLLSHVVCPLAASATVDHVGLA